MRILISADTYYPHVNGASYFSQRLAFYLQKRGHEIAVIAPSTSYKNTKEQVNGILVYGIKSLPVWFYKNFRFVMPWNKRAIKKAIEDFKPDIVHIQNHFFIGRNVVKIAKRKHVPIVATNHFMPENLVHYLPVYNFIRNIIKKIAWWDFSRIFNKVDKITTPTEIAANFIRDKVSQSVASISCGIDFEKFNNKLDGSKLIERYGIPNKPILLSVGRLDKEKNIDVVLRALEKALKKVDIHFVVAGSGAEKNNLIALAKELGIKDKVSFVGFVPDEDLPCLYAIANCFIIAGTAELQGIVTMEAMATGLPIVGVNAVANPELVHDGENGFLFEIKDVKDLSEKIVKIFSDKELREKMGANSLEIIQKHDIWKSIFAFEEIYKGTSEKLSSTALSGNFDSHVLAVHSESKFPGRLVSDSFLEVPKDLLKFKKNDKKDEAKI